ncbi:MAG: hypothetical protein MJ134_10960 [Lachnospiraceae bacterium]|nr:hypothetical protein [Lachnospiraceae bacterium]
MNDKLRELYEKVSGDDNLKESFTKGIEAAQNEEEKKKYIIDFAKEQGITLTMEDFPKVDGVQQLPDEALDNVAGGWSIRAKCGDNWVWACSKGIYDGGPDDVC